MSATQILPALFNERLDIQGIGKRIPSWAFDYINIWNAEVLHAVACGDGWVYAIGHRNDASYEWVAHAERSRITWSNVGYGSLSACLRDGLLIGCGDREGYDEAHGRIGGELATES